MLHSMINDITTGIRAGLNSQKDRVYFILLWILFFVFMFLIPVWNTPGNSLRFQAELFRLNEYLVLIVLSCLSALSLYLQWVAFRTSRNGVTQEALLGGGGLISGLLSSLFASASCVTCVGALFSFLGFNTVLFLAIHRWYILAFAFVLLLVSIYLAARKITRGCEVCLVEVQSEEL